MKADAPLTQQELETLFAWLDPDLNCAAHKYEIIRRGLIQRFVNRGCMDAESLADETIDRVTKKVAEISIAYQGNPASYFHGVARNVFFEYCRERRNQAKNPPPEMEPTFSEVYYDCLERCLAELSTEKRDLILRYYSEIKRAKIESRKKIRQELSVNPDALRVRTYRIRKTLDHCVRKCVERNEMV
jgi:DNA-directed RNA polymerase specialized sigma24 family protein